MPITPDVYSRIVAAKVYIDANFQEAIDLDHLSRHACLSRYHFHRLFTRIYQKTPHQYLTQKRVEQARQWLAGQTPVTVSEICNNVGFESIGSFSALFKKETGSAPQHYRNKARLIQQQIQQEPRSVIPHCFLNHFHPEPPSSGPSL